MSARQVDSFGATRLPRIVDVAYAQYFLSDPDTQRHQRFAALDQRTIHGTRLLDAAVDQVAQFQQREPLPLDFARPVRAVFGEAKPA